MPEITELPFDYDTLSLSEEDEFRTRSPGLHLTDITRDMLLTAGLAKWKTETDPVKRKMQFEKGFLWERLIQHVLQAQANRDVKASQGRLTRTGEYTSHGVIATPDALDTVSWHLEEWKATAISPENLNQDTLRSKKPEWLWNAGWHLEHFGMSSVIFRIWHHREFDPTIKQYKATFYPDELRVNKEMIINHAIQKGMLSGQTS